MINLLISIPNYGGKNLRCLDTRFDVRNGVASWDRKSPKDKDTDILESCC